MNIFLELVHLLRQDLVLSMTDLDAVWVGTAQRNTCMERTAEREKKRPPIDCPTFPMRGPTCQHSGAKNRKKTVLQSRQGVS